MWGIDGTAYAGRRMTLYRDDAVQFGGAAVGGIRISHISGISSAVTMPLTVTRASRKPFTVKPLPEERDQGADKSASPKPTLLGAAREEAKAGRDTFKAWRDRLRPHQVQALREIEGELDRLMDEADTRDDGPPLDDDFPGFALTAEEAA